MYCTNSALYEFKYLMYDVYYTFDTLRSVQEQQGAISSVIAGSSKTSDRDMIPSNAELRKCGYICSKSWSLWQKLQLFFVQRRYSHFLLLSQSSQHCLRGTWKHQMKTAIVSNFRAHIGDPGRPNLRLLTSVLDPRHKDLRFVPLSEQA